MRRLGGVVLALALVSCDLVPSAGPKVPTGVMGDIAQNVAALLAPGVDVMDARFDAFLADMDLAKALGSRADEVTAQIRSGRATVTKPASSRGSAGGRLASVPGIFGESIVLEFAKLLANSLDEFTKASANRELPRLPPTPHVQDGPTTTTQTVRSQTTNLSSTGARVTLTVTWSYRETTTDKASGATLVEIVEDRLMVGAITVCPDPLGAVGAFIDAKSAFTGVANGQRTTLTTTSGSVFTGYVGDNASLQNVHHTLQDTQSWESTTGSGRYEANFSASARADASGSTASGVDSSSFSGAINGSDSAALARGLKAAAWSFVLDGHSLDEAYQKAQRLWRNGRCVMVLAPDYGAETPIDVARQEERQHDEEVEQSSETKFAVNLKHRFEGGVPNQPITAALTSGGKSVEPNRIESVPSSVTYKAPDEDDKSATLLLRTTSKRGIGTLVLDFHTGGGLTLTLTGELSGNDTSFATVRILDRLTIGPLEFKKTVAELWEAKGTWRSETSSFTAALGETQTCTGSESGDVTMMARVEKRGDTTVWVVDPLDSDATGTGSMTCEHSLGGTTLRGVTLPRSTTHDSSGDSAGIFIGVLETIVIPQEGGRVPVRGSQGTFTASGTATATTGN